MLNKHIAKWCTDLKSAWISNDIKNIMSIFSQTTTYYEDPFAPPGTNITEIRSFWEEIAFQDIISLVIEPIMSNGHYSTIHWYLEYKDTRDNSKYIMDGIYVVEFNAEHHCVSFRQWWVIKE